MKPTAEILASIIEEVRPLTGQGKVADYIPALAKVPSEKLGIAVFTNQGEVISAGDAQEGFSIQSISKVLSLTLAMGLYQPDELWSRVGKEPSGQAFNSLIQLEMEQGIPRNPFINAGAIVVCDMLQSRLSAPRQRLLEFVRQLSGEPLIAYDKVVAASEMMHSDRNAAIAYLMRSFGNFHNEVIPVLHNYFHACALKMSCVELAKTFSYLANKGVSVVTGETVITPTQSKQTNALLATCGLYDGQESLPIELVCPENQVLAVGLLLWCREK